MWTFPFGNSLIQVSHYYLACAFVGQVVIRAVITFLRSWELVCPTTDDRPLEPIVLSPHQFDDDGFLKTWLMDFFSCHPSAKVKDYFSPTLLGLIELLIYPTLMLFGAWFVIAGWFTLKTAAVWGAWKSDRNSYNRFLLGNALVILASIFLISSKQIMVIY